MKKNKSNKVKTTKFGAPSKFDINGSYTGTPALDCRYEAPIQDADDL